eukprot:7705691-Ditylum_brightwellii.AAC.1
MRGFQNATFCLDWTTTSQDNTEDWMNWEQEETISSSSSYDEPIIMTVATYCTLQYTLRQRI